MPCWSRRPARAARRQCRLSRPRQRRRSPEDASIGRHFTYQHDDVFIDSARHYRPSRDYATATSPSRQRHSWSSWRRVNAQLLASIPPPYKHRRCLSAGDGHFLSRAPAARLDVAGFCHEDETSRIERCSSGCCARAPTASTTKRCVRAGESQRRGHFADDADGFKQPAARRSRRRQRRYKAQTKSAAMMSISKLAPYSMMPESTLHTHA